MLQNPFTLLLRLFPLFPVSPFSVSHESSHFSRLTRLQRQYAARRAGEGVGLTIRGQCVSPEGARCDSPGRSPGDADRAQHRQPRRGALSFGPKVSAPLRGYGAIVDPFPQGCALGYRSAPLRGCRVVGKPFRWGVASRCLQRAPHGEQVRWLDRSTHGGRCCGLPEYRSVFNPPAPPPARGLASGRREPAVWVPHGATVLATRKP